MALAKHPDTITIGVGQFDISPWVSLSYCANHLNANGGQQKAAHWCSRSGGRIQANLRVKLVQCAKDLFLRPGGVGCGFR